MDSQLDHNLTSEVMSCFNSLVNEMKWFIESEIQGTLAHLILLNDLLSRLAEHRGYVTNKVTDKSTGEHFNLPGHSLADIEATVIEQTQGKGSEYRKEREHYFIRKFNTYYKGLIKQK